MFPTAVLRRLGPTLPLDEFLFRQQVKHTYRQILRLIYGHHERDDLLAFIRPEFRIEGDLTYRKYLLNQGIQRAKDMAQVMAIPLKL